MHIKLHDSEISAQSKEMQYAPLAHMLISAISHQTYCGMLQSAALQLLTARLEQDWTTIPSSSGAFVSGSSQADWAPLEPNDGTVLAMMSDAYTH